MSKKIKLELRSKKETDVDDKTEINLSLFLSEEKNYRIREILKNIHSENSKDVVENLIRVIAESETERFNSTSFSDFENEATFVLGEFGIPAHTKGYRYLKEAVVLVAQKPLFVDGITKNLYPAIAEHYGTTSARVERVVRHAIESGCTKGDTQALYYYFPHSISKDKLKPTNAEFIAVIGDVVKKRVSKRQLIFADI